MSIGAGHKADMTAFYNVTRPISAATPVYPGDPPFVRKILSTAEGDGCCTLSKISMSNHLGTHVDFPAHFIVGGKTSSDYQLQDLMGHCVVIEVEDSVKVIMPEHFKSVVIAPDDIVFFKTHNSLKGGVYTPDFTTLSQEAAEHLKALKVKIVGIDGMSVDPVESHDFQAHRILLGSGILIVENLVLKEVPAGKWHVRIYPLPITGIDGAPATVTLESLGNHTAQVACP